MIKSGKCILIKLLNALAVKRKFLFKSEIFYTEKDENNYPLK